MPEINRQPAASPEARPPCFGLCPLLFRAPCDACAVKEACLKDYQPPTVRLQITAAVRKPVPVQQQRKGATFFDVAAYAAISRVAEAHGFVRLRDKKKVRFGTEKRVVFSIIRADPDRIVLSFRDLKRVRDAADAVGCVPYENGKGVRWRLSHDGNDLAGMQTRLRQVLLAALPLPESRSR